jgi:hypothetical protein
MRVPCRHAHCSGCLASNIWSSLDQQDRTAETCSCERTHGVATSKEAEHPTQILFVQGALGLWWARRARDELEEAGADSCAGDYGKVGEKLARSGKELLRDQVSVQFAAKFGGVKMGLGGRFGPELNPKKVLGLISKFSKHGTGTRIIPPSSLLFHSL